MLKRSRSGKTGSEVVVPSRRNEEIEALEQHKGSSPQIQDFAINPEETNPPSEKTEARYMYCIAECGQELSLGRIGMNSCHVFTVPYKDLCAVVHQSSPIPYNSTDQELVKSWVVSHEEVVERAWEKFGTVVPFSFNTIVKGGETSVEEWLSSNYERLRGMLDRLRNKEEYGLQILLDSRVLADLASKDEYVKKLRAEIAEKPQGSAYFYRRKLEEALRNNTESLAKSLFRESYSMIRACVDDIRVGKVKESNGDKIMIANLSLLAVREHVDRVKSALTELNKREGLSIRFTGPWPPYSFTT